MSAFTAHNILLDDGRETFPGAPFRTADNPRCISAIRTLKTVFGNDLRAKTIVDLGCLEGGYAVEFARLGMQTLGIEARQSNIDKCAEVRRGLALDNLRFVRDDIRNISAYGSFDAIFCSGVLYHLDQPARFLQEVAKYTKKCIIIHTHFATESPGPIHHLSHMTENEGVPGRWFDEPSVLTEAEAECHQWSAWNNERSFWLTKPALLEILIKVGFDTVFEQFDWLGPNCIESITTGFYSKNQLGMFVAVNSRS